MGLFSGANMAAAFQGEQLMLGQQQAQADLDMKQQQIQSTKMQNLMQQQQLQDKQALQQFMSSQQEAAGQPTQSAVQKAQLYQKGSEFALGRGDYDLAAAMDKASKAETETASKELQLQQQQQVTDQEAMSTAAQDVGVNPSPENNKKLFAAAIKAGVSPDQIPMPGTPAYAAFVNQSALAPLKGKDRLTYMDKVREEHDKAKATEEEHKRQDDLKAEQLRATAEVRAGQHEIAKGNLELRKQLADAAATERADRAAERAAKASGGLVGGAIGFRQDKAVVNYANEAVRNLKMLSQFDSTQTAGVFAHLGSPGTIVKALETTGTNKLTPEVKQVYQTASVGMALEAANLAMAGSNRSADKTIRAEFSRMAEASSGDTELEAMFKLSNMASFIKARLDTVPTNPDPHIQQTREKVDRALAKYPDPNLLIAAARAKGHSLDKAQSQSQLMMDKLNTLRLKSDLENPPPDVQAILDRYPSH